MILQDSSMVSIVLPCFQQGRNIEEGASRISGIMKTAGFPIELIFVDDGSRDDSRKVILGMERSIPGTRSLLFDENQGRGWSFASGAKIAKGKYIGYIDIDLDISEKYLPEVLNLLDKGYDVVTVKRKYATGGPAFFFRNFSSKAYRSLVSFILRTPPMDTETGFKFFKREALLFLLTKTGSKRWFFDTEIMCLAHKYNFKISEVEGICERNRSKTSTVRLIPDSFRQAAELLRFRRKMKTIEP